MNTKFPILLVMLTGVACGPPGLVADSDTDSSSTDPGETSTSTSDASTATSDTSTSTSGTSGADSDDTVGFVPMTDFGNPSECDPFDQDCPEGEKCVPWGSTGGNWDANKCVPVLGDQAVGDPCTYDGTVDATDNCNATSMCWDVIEVDGEPIGTCHAFCLGTYETPECPEGSQCLVSSSGVINLCIPTCDPLLQDCGEGHACYWANNGFNCVFTTQDIPPGEPCGYINDCVAGNGCVTAEVLPSCAGAACCSPWCLVGGGDLECGVLPGTACVPFFEDDTAPPGYDDVGVCILP